MARPVEEESDEESGNEDSIASEGKEESGEDNKVMTLTNYGPDEEEFGKVWRGFV